MHLAPNAEGFRPQKTHRWPQLLSTFRANTCCPTRAAARIICSVCFRPDAFAGAPGDLLLEGDAPPEGRYYQHAPRPGVSVIGARLLELASGGPR
jgi:hypothetical protein